MKLGNNKDTKKTGSLKVPSILWLPELQKVVCTSNPKIPVPGLFLIGSGILNI